MSTSSRRTHQAAPRLAWAWGDERRQRWVLDRERSGQRANLYIERQDLSASVPPDRSADLDQARHQWPGAEQDAAALRTGTGRWACGPAGQAARALRQAAASAARSPGVEPGLRSWARHKARRRLRKIGSVEIARTLGTAPASPTPTSFETARHQLATKAAQLEEAQRAHDTFMFEHPEVPAPSSRARPCY